MKSYIVKSLGLTVALKASSLSVAARRGTLAIEKKIKQEELRHGHRTTTLKYIALTVSEVTDK